MDSNGDSIDECLNTQTAISTYLCVSNIIYDYVVNKFVDYDPSESLEVGACGVDGSWDTTCRCNDYEAVCESDIGCGGDWINWYETPIEENICCLGSVEAIYENIGGSSWDYVNGVWTPDCGTLDGVDVTDCIVDRLIIPW